MSVNFLTSETCSRKKHNKET